MKFEKQEIAKVILLDNKLNVLKIKNIAMGGSNFVNITMKDILQEAVRENSPKIILAHNHPSGSATPSLQDIKITKKIEQAASLLGIQVLDHIVIGNNEYTSIMAIEKWKAKF